MGKAIGELLSSKKFLMMIIGIIVWFAGRYGISLDPNNLYPPLALIVAGIFGQAIADTGKGAAQVDATTSRTQALEETLQHVKTMVEAFVTSMAVPPGTPGPTVGQPPHDAPKTEKVPS